MQGKVLIADDNELNAEIMKDILSIEGYEAKIVRDGEAVVKAFSDSAFGEFPVILMDIMMPKIDGWLATKRIRALKRGDAKSVKIYACTGLTLEDNEILAKEAGLDGLFGKPIDVEFMIDRIKSDLSNQKN